MHIFPGGSHVLDMLHCVYIPYVDIFRADRYVQSRVAKIAEGRGTILAPDLLELPELIQEVASRRGLT
jgi:hypothetical protein